MRKKFFRFFVLLFLSMTFFSCAQAKRYFNIAYANYCFEQGFFQKANYLYLKDFVSEKNSDIVAYNLGNVYFDLAASEEALKWWEIAKNSNNQDLRFRVAFNQGILNYNLGKYNEAFLFFREAILIKPKHFKYSNLLAAKNNLQLCLDKLRLEDNGSASTQTKTITKSSSANSKEFNDLMNLVKEREALNWATGLNENPIDEEDY